MIHLQRMLKGLIFFGVTFLFAINYSDIRNEFWNFLIANEYSSDWLHIMSFVGIFVVSYFVVGLYYMLNFHLERNPVFENTWADALRGGSVTPQGLGGGNGSHINNIKNYRDSVLSTQSQSDGAKEYMKTAWIDGLDSIGGKHTNSAKNYINSKMATMDNSTAYEWLKSNSN